MLSKILRQFLFILIHFVVKILVAVQNIYYQFCETRILPDKHVTKRDVLTLLDSVPKLKKKLKHLVVLVDTSVHSMSDLALLVIWSLIVGVPFVSFHDLTGQLKKHEEDLFMEIERKKKGVPGCIKWSNKPDLNGYTNGTQANTVYINIFSQNDGRQRIVQCVNLLAKDRLKSRRCSEEYTAQEFNDALIQLYPNIPDPELVLYTGPMCCTYGLLPWHIRLTEFIQLSVNHNVNINSYLGALYKYNKCDQRFGK
ncbi:dehydrodolichyl diphosphate synthase complex subunit nus1 [Bicyclus anynana]|uniref:ditrans,polycis-polyprenyl diphosphate synthase [(2E,6E)-farnesyldiphosphate specific] n=1 Tax=Bicyclus anynana TaxID=110368 RepID=A0A6J1NM67_BICAN|nr:dehydrodolichyl diphosphate synthase complex subunit nus1 [Bicyclus anynana]